MPGSPEAPHDRLARPQGVRSVGRQIGERRNPVKAIALPGRCRCGRVSFVLREEPISFYLCHCTLCQAESGSAFGESMHVRREAIDSLEGPVREHTHPRAGRTAQPEDPLPELPDDPVGRQPGGAPGGGRERRKPRRRRRAGALREHVDAERATVGHACSRPQLRATPRRSSGDDSRRGRRDPAGTAEPVPRLSLLASGSRPYCVFAVNSTPSAFVTARGFSRSATATTGRSTSRTPKARISNHDRALSPSVTAIATCS